MFNDQVIYFYANRILLMRGERERNNALRVSLKREEETFKTTETILEL